MKRETDVMELYEMHGLLNELLEAERAGAMVASTYVDELPVDGAIREELLRVQRDESRNCAVLLDLLRASGADPSRRIGGFFEKALAIQGPRERVAFLNRGQAWVARRLAAALPRIPDARVREALEAMHLSHLANIQACEAILGQLGPRGA
ncbi:MAG TPA: DUF6306 domain-containing protein [Usitatibacter sp.]|nr:DUF6306 domain-containing protein [Usitatibacter sp.]